MSNLGDDIMLDVFCKEIMAADETIEVTVALLNGDRSKLELPDGVRILDLSKFKYGKSFIFDHFLNRTFDAFFWIGGTCFTENAGNGSYNYMNSFARLGKKTGYLGVGIGNVKSPSKVQRYTHLLNQASIVTFRDVESFNQAKEWSSNQNLYYCEDLVHLIDIRKPEEIEGDRVIVSWRSLKGYYNENIENNAINELLRFMREHFEEGEIGVLFLGSNVDCEINRQIYDRISEMMPNISVQYSNGLSTTEKINHISKAKIAIMGRLHGIFIAEKMGIKTIAIGYDNKSERFLKSVGRECDLIYPDQVSQAGLNKIYSECLADKIDFTEKREAAMKNIQLFIEKVGGVNNSFTIVIFYPQMCALGVN